jgi:pimeloyl-ACP methyl ester carboxylesterase
VQSPTIKIINGGAIQNISFVPINTIWRFVAGLFLLFAATFANAQTICPSLTGGESDGVLVAEAGAVKAVSARLTCQGVPVVNESVTWQISNPQTGDALLAATTFTDAGGRTVANVQLGSSGGLRVVRHCIGRGCAIDTTSNRLTEIHGFVSQCAPSAVPSQISAGQVSTLSANCTATSDSASSVVSTRYLWSVSPSLGPVPSDTQASTALTFPSQGSFVYNVTPIYYIAIASRPGAVPYLKASASRNIVVTVNATMASPTVAINSPLNNAIFITPVSNIPLLVTTSAPPGTTIAQVQYLLPGEAVISSSTTPPFSGNLTTDAPTTFTITPRIVLTNGVFAYGTPITIFVRDPPTTTLIGRVVRYQQGALANATVDIGGGRATTTNANGEYRFVGLPMGQYTVRASRAGWTFGSPDFQVQNYTVNATDSITIVRDIVGYDRNPIVGVYGFTNDGALFNRATATPLRTAGYWFEIANTKGDYNFTPPLVGNVTPVIAAIDQARYVTGQPKVIMLGHSMGGLISRAYVEGFRYRGDVSQLFTTGSPHLGTPNFTAIICNPVLQGVCDMTKPGMTLFNTIHHQRSNVNYHVIGGNAPLWKPGGQWCFKIFGTRFCVNLPPKVNKDFLKWPGSWLLSLAIPGPDDGFIQTPSAIGMPGIVDRYVTRDVHDSLQGDRQYHWWEDATSQDTFGGCLSPVLIARSRANCGSLTGFRLLGQEQSPFLEASKNPLSVAKPGRPEYPQGAGSDSQTIYAGQRIEREFVVNGGKLIFGAHWKNGSVRVSLIDPSGQVFDPEFVQGSGAGEPTSADVITDELRPDMAVYDATPTDAAYQILAPRLGRWRLILEAGSDIPKEGTIVETNAGFSSTLNAEFANDFPYWVKNESVEIQLNLTERISSGKATVTIMSANQLKDTVTLTLNADGNFSGSYLVPDRPGYANISWTIEGTDIAGNQFARFGSDIVQISAKALRITKVGADSPVVSRQGNLLGVLVPVTVDSQYAGQAMVSGTLVDSNGTVVASAAHVEQMVIGSNVVNLKFAGADIFAHGIDGPYRLTDVTASDNRGALLLSDWKLDQLTTAPYKYRQFAPEHSYLRCNATNVLRDAKITASSTARKYNVARLIDGDNNTSFGPTYSWTNDVLLTLDARGTSGASALPANVDVALLGPRSIDKIVLHSTLDWEIRDYDLEYFDGTEWATIEQVRGNRETVRHHDIVPATSMSMIRVKAISGPDREVLQARVNELEAWSCKPQVLAE